MSKIIGQGQGRVFESRNVLSCVKGERSRSFFMAQQFIFFLARSKFNGHRARYFFTVK